MEVEERKIEDQARQQRAVAVLRYLLLSVGLRYCDFPPGEVTKGPEQVSACACAHVKDTVQLRCTVGCLVFGMYFTIVLTLYDEHTCT